MLVHLIRTLERHVRKRDSAQPVVRRRAAIKPVGRRRAAIKKGMIFALLDRCALLDLHSLYVFVVFGNFRNVFVTFAASFMCRNLMFMNPVHAPARAPAEPSVNRGLFCSLLEFLLAHAGIRASFRSRESLERENVFDRLRR